MDFFQLARSRISVALDTDSCDQAMEWATIFSPYASCMKIGKSLYSMSYREGRNLINEISKAGSSIFLDLKGHDTPDQIYKCATEWTLPTIQMWNIHITGGEKMVKEAIRGRDDTVEKFAMAFPTQRPLVIGVTRLTSLDDSDLETMGSKLNYNDALVNDVQNAINWGLDGVVCPASKAGFLNEYFPNSGLRFVTPGIQVEDIANVGQKQLYDPIKAIEDCENSTLVIGSGWTKSKTKVDTAMKTLEDMAKVLERQYNNRK